VLDEYPNTLRLVVKPFPSSDSQSSLLAASAALAAHAQGYFWAFREQLFLLDGRISISDLRDVAETVGLDLPRFYRDQASPEIQHLLVKGINDGVNSGVSATPTVFVNHTRMTSLGINDLRQAIGQAVAP
jgi:protein-disulfide isomerase